jgi:hypothetical protein
MASDLPLCKSPAANALMKDNDDPQFGAASLGKSELGKRTRLGYYFLSFPCAVCAAEA